MKLNFRQTHRLNWYIILWIFAFLIVGYLYHHWYVDKNYIGIVEKRIHTLGPQEPGRVQSLLVEVGERVSKDQVLASLDVTDLNQNLQSLQSEFSQIQTLNHAQKDHYAMVVQRLRLESENEATALIERMALIKSKNTELDGLNAEISRLKEAEKAGLGYSSNLTTLVIQRDALVSYLAELRKEADRLSAKLDRIRKSRGLFEKADDDSMTQSLLLDQMEYTEMVRREILETQNRIRMRTILAPCDGFVTAINARPGDVVQEFDSLLVVEEALPRYLIVFLPETSTLEPATGMKVKVNSARNRKFSTTGIVTFVHPGYTQASKRLTFRGINFWARKVHVQLAEDNHLLPGEVVTVRIGNHMSQDDLYAMGIVTSGEAMNRMPDLYDMTISNEMMRETRFEPSGITWIPDLNQFLIVSDDTGIRKQPNEHAPFVFLMDEGGNVAEAPVRLQGIDEVNDLEAVAYAGDQIYYILSSQNISKHDKRTANREYVLQVERVGEKFIVRSKINLLSLILNTYSPGQRANLGLVATEKDGRPVLNIEGAAWFDGALYLGLKEPALNGEAIIWKLNHPESLFKTGQLQPDQLSRFGTVRVGDMEGKAGTLSDLLFDSSGKLWALSTIPDVDAAHQLGRLLRIDRFADGQLVAKSILTFPQLKPEGLCLQDSHRMMIVFDKDQAVPSFCMLDTREL